jgi:hypothetical protein
LKYAGRRIMAIFSDVLKRMRPGGQTDPLQKQREQLSKSIIPGRTRLASMASEQGAPTAISGAFGLGSQTPTFQAEREEEQTGRRFNRRAGQSQAVQRIASRNGLGGAFGVR